MRRQLAQADKLAAVGLLASGVAHEINNPLGAILAFTQLLVRDRVDESERLEFYKEIETSALRCKEIVTRLSSFARRSRVDGPGTCDLNTIAGHVSFLVEKSVLPKGVTIEHVLERELWPVAADANEVSQVLLNFVSNACDAMTGRAGKIQIQTRNLVDEGSVELAVIDGGCGIPEADIDKIFDPFFTTKPEGKGRGLGLAVSWGIVRQMRGTIRVRSKLGEGSEFRVILPRALS
jgi:signal transduction histidine kinase